MDCVDIAVEQITDIIGNREESEVLEVLSFLEGDISLQGADISRQGGLQHPGN